MNLRRALPSLLSLAVLLCSGVALRAQAYTTIVVFGDSLSDTGNVAHLTQSAYGIRYPGILLDYTDGRFTDGSLTLPPAQQFTGLWIEQAAATLGAAPMVKDSLDGGTNYAYGDATTAAGSQVVSYSSGGTTFSITIQNVGGQIAAYLATHPVITNKTLFVVWGGANDVLQATTQAQITAAATLETANIQALIAAGATDFLIPNLPPLGAIPRLNGNAAASALATAGALGYNTALAAGVAGLPTANPGKTLRLFQMDIFSLFNSVLASPAVFGLVNATQSAQGQPVDPDEYLFWDDLHPTTYGHYLIARLAESVLTENNAAATTLSLGSANALAGQTVPLKAVVAAPMGTTTVPTGLVTFYSGSTAVATALLDATGTATASLIAGAVAGSPYGITAHYSGDGVYYANVSASANLTVLATPVATTTTLASSSASINSGSSVTLTATVTSPVGPPTGTVTFMDGMTVLGMGTLTAGATNSTATYTAAALGAGTHNLTAVLGANATYASSTSAALSVTVVAPSYTFTASPTMMTVSSGSSGSTTLTVTPVGGLTGTYMLACGTLPAHFSCSFSPTSVTLTGSNTAQTSMLTIATNVATAELAAPSRPGAPMSLPVVAAFALFPCVGGLALVGSKRRQLRSLHLTVLLIVLSGGALLGLAGCAKSSPNAPAGTYTVPVTLTPSGSGSSASLNITVVVQ